MAKIVDDSMVIDDEKDEVEAPPSIETSTYLVMEAKDDEFNLPNDRAPVKTSTKKSSTPKAGTKTKKKKIEVAATNSTRIKKKSSKNKGVTKISAKKPEKPITTQIYNYLAREVMPTVGVGLVGLVVTAGLATYFLGGPLTALRRSYDIASRRDDVAYDRSDDFGNMQDEGEMFGKVIAGMPENSAYRNNLRINSYRQKAQPYSGYQQQYTQVAKYGLQAQPQQIQQQQIQQQQIQQQQIQQQQQQYMRYRNADPYYSNSYQNQYPQYNNYNSVQAKSNEYTQSIKAAEQTEKFDINSVDMTTSEPSSVPSYSLEYDDIAQSYFPQSDQTQQMSVEEQKMHEVESKPQYVPAQSERSEKVTIINAQSIVPTNHKVENDESPLPTPEALKMSVPDDEYQNSIANAILNQSQKKQFVVGTVINENFEDNGGSSVPEHGPRRRKRNAMKPTGKSLENNEIDEDEKRQEEVTGSSTVEEVTTTTNAPEVAESTTSTYDIENGQNSLFHLVRRVIELKLRLGLNFLQNATLAFQEYLKGVEARVQSSPLFNPYANNNSSSNQTMTRKSNKWSL